MKSIELSLHADYCPTWHIWEGVRELLQNAKDAEIEQRAPMSVIYDSNNARLTIRNDNATLAHESLLFGYSTKRENTALLGKFGEGLKLGILALVRAGLPVKIYSGDEIWTPVLRDSQNFKARTLFFDITKDLISPVRVAIEIENFPAQEWERTKQNVRWLDLEARKQAPLWINGQVLLDEANSGRCYSKGIYVSNVADFYCGYDIPTLQIDRDRKMVNSYEFAWSTSIAWSELLLRQDNNPDIVAKAFELISSPTAQDLRQFHNYSYRCPIANRKILELFHTRFGEKARPVANMSESQRLEHLGVMGVVMPNHFVSFFEAEKGSLNDFLREQANSVTTLYSWHELTVEEKKTLTDALEIVLGPDAHVSMEKIHVVDFKGDTIEGQFHKDSGLVRIGRRILADLTHTAEVFLHEFAHVHGGDGDRSHALGMEKMAAKAMVRLYSAVNKEG